MRMRLRRLTIPVLSLVMGLMLAGATPAAATMTGGCTATGTGGYLGDHDFVKSTEWHVRDADQLSGNGTAPTAQSKVQVFFYVLSFPFPVITANGDPKTSSSGGPVAVHRFDPFVRVIPVGATSNDCSLTATIVVDDVNAFTTLVGIVALILMVLGLLMVAWNFARGSRIVGGIFGAIGGFLLGLGASLLLVQTSTIDPYSPIGWMVVALAFVVGAVLGAGRFGRSATPAAPAAPVAPGDTPAPA